MITENLTPLAPSDAQLVSDSLAGDRDAFGRIVARYQSLICSLAYCASGSLNQSEDLAQETFVTAWKELPGLREPAKLRSWLCGIARNTARNSHRRQERQPSHNAESLEASEWASPELAPAEQAIQHEEEVLLWRAVEHIPELYREPLVLFYREQQSVARVAEALDLNEEAVKQRLSRGRKMLQEEIAGYIEGALRRSVPGRAFTAAVLAQLPGGTTAVKTGSTAGMAGGLAAKGIGVLTSLASVFLFFAGNYFSYRSGIVSARSEEERRQVKRFYGTLFGGIVVMNLFFAALLFWAARGGKDHPRLLVQLAVALVAGVVLFMAWFSIAVHRGAQRLRQVEAAAGLAATTPPDWEYRSRTAFLGLPLVHIRIGGGGSARRPVKAWIAASNVAYGGLFAFGGMAIAPVSIGGLAIGLLPLGGCAVGLLALGGVALGWCADGGVAVGWNAFGACAAAWNAAQAECAVALNYATGTIGGATQFNTPAAEAYCQAQWFFRAAAIVLRYQGWLNLVWVLPMIQWWRIQRRAARKRASGAAVMVLVVLTLSVVAGRAATPTLSSVGNEASAGTLSAQPNWSKSRPMMSGLPFCKADNNSAEGSPAN